MRYPHDAMDPTPPEGFPDNLIIQPTERLTSGLDRSVQSSRFGLLIYKEQFLGSFLALCMILTFIINGASLYPYATSAFSLDLVMRFVAMSIILSAIAAVRGGRGSPRQAACPAW